MGSPTPTTSTRRARIARAAGVPEAEVIAALGGVRRFVGHTDAVRLGRQLVRAAAARRGRTAIVPIGAVPPTDSLFAIFSNAAVSRRPTGVPLALSSTLHASLIAFAVFLATFNLSPRAASLRPTSARPTRCGWSSSRPRGREAEAAAVGFFRKRRRQRRFAKGAAPSAARCPCAVNRSRPAPVPAPPEPKPEPLKAEPLPAVVAPIITAPADTRNRVGVLDETPVENESHGPAKAAAQAAGAGAGLGSGDGSGIGPGSGGGTGGGPYRPGSGIEPPRLLREVKADYTEDARQRSISGDVVLEIVVRRDGSVGDIRILQGLAGGLNDRAVQAVRQWRFSPAQSAGRAVDVIVEVAVEFKLR